MEALLRRVRCLKQRHWMVIGLVLGLLVASIVVLLPGLFVAQIQPEEFERAVTAGPLEGNPVARNVTVHVRSGYSFVTLDCLRPAGAAGSDATVYQYTSMRLDPPSPYIPKTASAEVVDLRINPGAAALGVEADEDSHSNLVPMLLNGRVVSRWGSRLELSDWTPHDDGVSAEPSDGAEANMSLRYGDYQVLIQVDTSQAEMNAADHLAISLNGKPLPALARTDELGVWRTQMTKDQFKLNERQVMQFAVKNGSIKIRQIQIADPNYTVLDYLAYVKGGHQNFDYDIGWWDNPKVAFPLFGGLGWFLVGILIPFIVRVIIRTRELMLLAKVKRASAMGQVIPGSPKLTIEDWMQLVDLIASLETSLREVLVSQAAAVGVNFGPRAEPPSPADTFVQRQPQEIAPVVEEDHDKEFGCRDDDVYPTELGAAVGHVLFTSEDARELNDLYRARKGKKSGKPSSHRK